MADTAGVVPTVFLQFFAAPPAQAAHAAYVHRTYVNRDRSSDSPAVRAEKAADVMQHLCQWLQPARKSTLAAYAEAAALAAANAERAAASSALEEAQSGEA